VVNIEPQQGVLCVMSPSNVAPIARPRTARACCLHGGRAGLDRRGRWTFGIVSVAWFAFALDRLVVSTALPVIRTDLQAAGGLSWADLEWTVNAYTLSFAVLMITGAALGDRFGRRRMFVLGLVSCAFDSLN
jgi:hypothetical protein